MSLLGLKPRELKLEHGGMTHEERMKHGHAAMKEFAEAMQRGDHAGMSAALRAHAAAHDADGEEYDHPDNEASEPGLGQ